MAHLDVPAAFLDFLRSHSTFFIAGHKEPDGDCIGSQIALAGILGRMGKKAYLCSAGPFTRPEVASFEGLFLGEIPPSLKGEGAAALVVDCSNLARTGSLETQLAGIPIAVIDHHSASENEGDANYLDPKAPAVAFMVAKLYAELGMEIPKDEAELLLFGLCTDTGYFRHLGEGSGETLRTAAVLVDAGASPKAVHAKIYGGKAFASRKLMGRILARAEQAYGGRLIVSYETLQDAEDFGLESRDSDMLYQLLQSVSGSEALLVIRQEAPDNCTVGFRSRDRIDVGSIAARFGGGGHKNAAGLSIPGKIDEVKAKLIEAFAPEFP